MALFGILCLALIVGKILGFFFKIMEQLLYPVPLGRLLGNFCGDSGWLLTCYLKKLDPSQDSVCMYLYVGMWQQGEGFLLYPRILIHVCIWKGVNGLMHVHFSIWRCKNCLFVVEVVLKTMILLSGQVKQFLTVSVNFKLYLSFEG